MFKAKINNTAVQGLILILYFPPESIEMEEKEFQIVAIGVPNEWTAGTDHHSDHQQKHTTYVAIIFLALTRICIRINDGNAPIII